MTNDRDRVDFKNRALRTSQDIRCRCISTAAACDRLFRRRYPDARTAASSATQPSVLHPDGRQYEPRKRRGYQCVSIGLAWAFKRVESAEPDVRLGNQRDVGRSGYCRREQLWYVDGMRVDFRPKLHGNNFREYNRDGELYFADALHAQRCHHQPGERCRHWCGSFGHARTLQRIESVQPELCCGN